MFVTYNGGPESAVGQRGLASTDAVDSDATAQATTADAFARRGAASAARRDYEGALSDLDKACELEPMSATFFAQRGAIQRALRRPAQALEDFDKALELDPTEVDARYRRASMRVGGKDLDGATADLDALDKALASQAHMRLAMSRLYMQLERPAQALAPLNQWLPAHPHEITRDQALNSRCWARVLLGAELDQALDDCDDAIDSDGKNASYLDSPGWVYLRLGKYKKV